MPISEQSFGDRLSRGYTMHAAIAAMSPTFTPADTSLTPANFKDFLDDDVTDANDAVGTANGQLDTPMVARQGAVVAIKELTTQATGYVKSNKAWASQFPAVKRAADKVRDIKAPRPKPATPPAPGTPPPKPARNRGDGSFGDVAVNFGQFLAALAQLVGYNPADADISLASLGAKKTGLDTLNTTVAAKEVALSNAQAARLEVYNGEEGLREKMLAIKEGVKGQFGSSSAEHSSVKGIKV